MCEDDLEPLPVAATVGPDGSVKISPESEYYVNWKREDWAQEQLDIAQRDLVKDPHAVEPFNYFLMAMDTIAPKDGMKLLDVGCGVGLYSTLIDKYFPNIEYAGFDFSEAMIVQAKKNFGHHEFFVADFRDVDYGEYDIVLASGLITIAPEFKEMVDWILEKSKDFVIWHRVFVSDDPRSVYPVITPTYGGKKGFHFFFNQDNLTRYLLARSAAVEVWTWAEHRKEFRIATFLCYKNYSVDEPAGVVSGTQA